MPSWSHSWVNHPTDRVRPANALAASPPHYDHTGRPIKQEKRDSGSETQTRTSLFDYLWYRWITRPLAHAESQHDIQSQSQTESGESHKLMIRVAHRPSKQESKFTTKGTTKVAKVLAGACKSFGLDANQ